VEDKGIHNIFNNIITENFQNIQKEVTIQLQEASSIPNRLDENRTSQQHIIIKMTSTEKRERTLKALRD
jgi:hypothetical protein